ncbi:MAG: hypothetical protein ACTSVI_14370 [Promethearchaeota archaeon]
MFSLNALKKYDDFCKSMGLKQEEVNFVYDMLRDISKLSNIEEIDYDAIKEIMSSNERKEKITLVAYAILKAILGEKLIYLLIASMVPKNS